MRHRVSIFVGFLMTVGVVGRGQFRLGDIAPTTEGACATLGQLATVPVAVAAAASDTQRLRVQFGDFQLETWLRRVEGRLAVVVLIVRRQLYKCRSSPSSKTRGSEF